MSSQQRLLAAILILSAVCGCRSYGPGNLSPDRFDYNQAIAQSRDEQMLLNIVRIRYLKIPDFLAVSSVITSYSYNGSAALSGSTASDPAPDIASGSLSVGYSEKPTITYSPLAGQEFSRRMLRPIPVEVMFSLGQAGWPTDILMTIGLQRINDVKNMSFGQVPSPGDVDRDEQFRREKAKLQRFQRVLQLMLLLADRGVMEVMGDAKDPDGLPLVQFAADPPPTEAEWAAEFRKELALRSDVNTFKITDRSTHRDESEITLRTRSLLAVMSFLSQGIEVPEADAQAGVVISMPPKVKEAVMPRIPLRIRSSSDRPDTSYVAVRYRDHWFYVEDTDIKSKRTFATVLVLFQLLAPSGGGQAPLLTLPTG